MSLQPEECCLAFFVEWMCYHWILLFFLRLQYLYLVITQDFFLCVYEMLDWHFFFFQNLIYVVLLHVQHLFYKEFSVIWIAIPIFVMCLFAGCCLQGFVSLFLIYSVYMICLRVVFFDFILFGIHSFSWICKFVFLENG